jgi:hypothetical protein
MWFAAMRSYKLIDAFYNLPLFFRHVLIIIVLYRLSPDRACSQRWPPAFRPIVGFAGHPVEKTSGAGARK